MMFLYYIPALPYESREYIASPLKEPLKANKNHYVDFYTTPSRQSKYRCKSLGVYLSIGHQYYDTPGVIPVSPQSDTLTTLAISDSSKWFHYSSIFL